MKAEPAESAVLPHPGGAANEEVMPLRSGTAIGSSPSSSGWTAFEVWRSRIKDVYDARVALASQDRKLTERATLAGCEDGICSRSASCEVVERAVSGRER
jgi:hypothetical protein